MYLPQERKTDLPVDRDILNCQHMVRMMYIPVERDLLTRGERVCPARLHGYGQLARSFEPA